MIQTLIYFIIYIVIFCIVAYGLIWVCDRFGLPQPVKWLCGAVLLIILLLFVAAQLPGGGSGINRMPLHRVN